MHDVTNVPSVVPVPASEQPAPPARGRAALWVGVGAAVGLVLGVLLTAGVVSTYVFFTNTIPAPRATVQVFNELNELRQELNRLNEMNKVKDQEKLDAVREALSAVRAAARTPEAGKPAADPKQVTKVEAPPAPKAVGPLADVDAEIERLEKTQKVLNTILDIFSRNRGDESGKDR